MHQTSTRRLLTDAPSGRHFCQLHRDPAALTAAVTAFAQAGLDGGDAVVLVMGADRAAAVAPALRRSTASQLVLLDADATLAEFMTGGVPDWDAFRATIGGVLDRVKASGHRRVRAYGEMVSVLWREGKPDAAVRLEEHWNRLAREYRFCLFCGYELDGLDAASYSGPLHDVGRVHSDFPESQDDQRLLSAIDAASHDVFGVRISALLTHSGIDDRAGEHKLPTAQRAVLWLQRNMPHAVEKVLKRARRHYGDDAAGAAF